MSANKGRKWHPKLVIEWVVASAWQDFELVQKWRGCALLLCMKCTQSSRVMELPEIAKNMSRVASENWHGAESENKYKFSNHWYFLTLLLESYSSRSKQFRDIKIGIQVQRVCTINRSPHPLPVIYMYGTGVSDYTCHPNIHHLLYIIESTDSMIDSICRNSVDTQ